VVIQDGQTLVIGGIMETTRDYSTQGVPFIRRIPVLRRLFGTDRSNYSKTELLIVITPHVLETPEDAIRETTAFRSTLEAVDELIRQRRSLERVR
jgi:general secretion pathway protein D